MKNHTVKYFMDVDLTVYQRLEDGDEKALEELIKTHRASLTAFINGFVNDADAAESLMIDVFVDLVRKKGSFRGESTLKTYLFAIGRNKALRYLKKRKRYNFVPLEEVECCLASDAEFEEKLEAEARRESVRAAMKKLPPAYREVIYLLYFEEMSYEQAARVMHKSIKQVTNLAYRAKQSLKKLLTEGGGKIE